MKSNTKGILYVATSGISFGVMPMLAKFAYAQGISTYSLLFLRFLIASIILYVYIRYNKISMDISKVQKRILILLGFLGYAGTALCLFLAYRYISAGLATMILYAYPALVILLTFIVYKEKLSLNKIISLIFSLSGIYLLLGDKNVSISTKGVLLAMGAALLYCLYVMGVSHKTIKHINSYVITFYVSSAACVSILIAGLFNRSINLKITMLGLVLIILLAFISTVVSLMTFVQGVKLIGPSKAAIISNLEPIVSMILGIVIFKDKVTAYIITGSIMVLLSITIVSVDFRGFKIMGFKNRELKKAGKNLD